jgi:DNA helicase MCM8
MENIRISNAILSRFDMVFLLLDDPDLMRDKKLSEHVMKLHSRNRKRKLDSFLGSGAPSEAGQAFSMSFAGDISKRMRPNNGFEEDDDEIEIISST